MSAHLSNINHSLSSPPVSASPRLRGSTPLLKLSDFAKDIKLSHSVFALPFALLSTFLAAQGWPRVGQLLLILLCMVTARTVAMAMNRLLDAEMDAANPRTARRAIPGGALSRGYVATAVAVCSTIFIASTGLFWVCYNNRWPLLLSVPVLLFLSGYPLLKRFTRLCHYYMGIALAIAPICAWIAIRGEVAMTPIWMALAVASWTAGFDIIYACQDYESDVKHGVFSVPAKIGIGKALWVARLTHIFSAAMLVTLGLWARPVLGTLYFIGAGIAILLLIIEHAIVKPNDLSRVGLAFFTINGVISLLLGTLGILDVLRHG